MRFVVSAKKKSSQNVFLFKDTDQILKQKNYLGSSILSDH